MDFQGKIKTYVFAYFFGVLGKRPQEDVMLVLMVIAKVWVGYTTLWAFWV